MADIDKLKLLCGEPIEVCEGITLLQPTIRQVKEFGEAEFYNSLWMICSAAWDMPAMFDDMGVDFMSISDWEFFRSVIGTIKPEALGMIFQDINFADFQPMLRTQKDGEQDIVLYRASDQFIIDEVMYKEFIKYIREMIGFTHKGRKAGNKATAKILIMEDRKERERHKDKPYESMLFGVIISLVNTEEFAYTYETVLDVTVYQLTKSLMQIQGKKSAMALLQGSMSGFADTSKVPQIDFSWIYSEEKYKPRGKKLVNNVVKK